MADLQSKPLIELNLDTREITITNNIKYIDIDKNIANIFLQIYREDNTGLKAYLSKEELDSFVGKMFLIKPVTNDFTEITGINTEEFKSDNGGGVLRFIIPTEYTNRNGIVKCEIHINRDNELLASDRFVYNVKQSLVTQFNNDLLEDSDFPILQQLILEIQKANNINDSAASPVTTYSSNKIENIKEELDSQIKDKVSKGDRELHVGIKQDFTSIQDAIDNVTSEKNVIIVHEGQYKEKLVLNEMNVTIKGVDKDLVTIWNDVGRYGNEPLLIRGGNVKISNLDILSKYEDIGSDNGCYALHIDRSEDSSSNYPASEIIIENCNITSYNHAGIGCGTENNQSIKIVNCNISSYANVGVLYHTSIVNMEDQKFSLINCNLFSDTFFPLLLKNNTPNSSGFEVEFINNNLIGNNSYTQGVAHENNILNALSKNSYGNNDKKINYMSPNQMYQLTSDNGNGIEVTDFNSVTTGFFKGDGSNNCLNTPTAEWYIGYSVSYGSDYIVQFAFAILNNFKMYTRFKTTAWSDWAECNIVGTQVKKLTKGDGTCMSITDLNNATSCGYYSIDATKGGLNCPTNDAVYIVQVISYSTTGFLVQYAWAITGSNIYKKYKRGKDANIWSSWVEVSE